MNPLSNSKRSFLRAGLGLSLAGLGISRAQAAGGLEQFYKYNIPPETWLAEVFGGQVPPPQVAPGGSFGLMQPLPGRVRYWRANGRTAWVFDDIGKVGYAPTTCGFVVKAGAIESAKVLIYRESRADQVGTPSFLNQLIGAKSAGAGIDRKVDNISGATYSVDMMKRMANAALQLDKTVPA
ncbi:FMN-binding protein [Hydrocarboniphaga sp.]|uniref:FMN-binding protein n=1 Tax=Hydrocarboniphaga sp. TaxID=2033016 RepID=UPI002625B6BE|nr:FMN-binding protein [Hydrocarboniphaga sp.]